MLFCVMCKKEELLCFEGQDDEVMYLNLILTNLMLDNAQKPSHGCIFGARYPISMSYNQKLAFFETHVECLALHDAVNVAFSYQRITPLAVRM